MESRQLVPHDPAAFKLPIANLRNVTNAARLAWKVRRRVARPADAAAHGVLMVVEKWANLAGQVRYVLDRGRGQSPRLIEYKHPAASHAAD